MTSSSTARARPSSLGFALRRIEKVGFLVAVVAYLLPFVDYHWFVAVGVELAIAALVGVFVRGSEATSFLIFATLMAPPVAALAGLLYRRKATWRSALAGLLIGAVGFGGLAPGYLSSPRPSFALGYYTAECGFLLAAIAAAFRLIRAINQRQDLGPEPAVDEMPAMSAAQELLQRNRLQR